MTSSRDAESREIAVATALWNEAGCPDTWESGNAGGKAKFLKLAKVAIAAYLSALPITDNLQNVPERITVLKEELENCRQYIREHHNASFGWWNYEPSYKRIKRIDELLGTYTR